jgi:hypothetical protein
LSFSEFDGQPLGTCIQFVYFNGGLAVFSALQKMEGVQWVAWLQRTTLSVATRELTREKLDKIIEVLDLRDAAGKLLQPPVGDNCNYQLVLEKGRQPVPPPEADKSRIMNRLRLSNSKALSNRTGAQEGFGA